MHSDLQQPEPDEPAPGSFTSQRSRRQSRPGLPWQWLGIAFLVVLILAAVLYVVRGLPAAPPVVEPTATPTVTEFTPTPKRARPTPIPTAEPPTPAPTSEASASETEIRSGVEVEVSGTGVDGLSVRSGPGLNYARLKTAYDGETFTVLDGPEEANGHRWWHLEDAAGTVGWGAENWLQLAGQ